MVTRDIARITAPFEAVASRRAEGQRDRRAVQGEAKLVPIEFDLRGDIDVVLAARRDEPSSSVPRSFTARAKVSRESVSNRVSSALAFVSMRFSSQERRIDARHRRRHVD